MLDVLLRLVCNIILTRRQWPNIHFHLIWRGDKGLTISFYDSLTLGGHQQGASSTISRAVSFLYHPPCN